MLIIKRNFSVGNVLYNSPSSVTEEVFQALCLAYKHF